MRRVEGHEAMAIWESLSDAIRSMTMMRFLQVVIVVGFLGIREIS